MKPSVDKIGLFKAMRAMLYSRRILFIDRCCQDEVGENTSERVRGTYFISMSKKAVILSVETPGGKPEAVIAKAWKVDDLTQLFAHDTASSGTLYIDTDGGRWRVLSETSLIGEHIYYDPPGEDGIHYIIALKPL